jgi:EF hand
MRSAWLTLIAALAACSEEAPTPDLNAAPAARETAATPAKESLSIDQFREGQRGSFAQRDPDADNVVDLAQLTPRYRKQFKRMDADQDKRVTRAELERSITERFAAADTNKDGLLQPAEWK